MSKEYKAVQGRRRGRGARDWARSPNLMETAEVILLLPGEGNVKTFGD